MKYETIVEKNESSLLQIIQAAESFNAGGFLESLRKRNLSTYEIDQLPDNPLLKRKRQARSEKAFVRENYHQYTPAELKQMLMVELVKKGHEDGLTDEEALLWPNDHQQALRGRKVIPLFDQLDAEGLKGKMDSGIVIEFLKWCRVESKLEKRLYQYFCQAYKANGGRLQMLGWSSVCQVRKDRRDQRISDEEQAESFESRLAAIA
jgi:hypothetical protein